MEREVEIKDFFVSYNRADSKWAEWVAWQLEDAGFTTILQSWDFRPGSNFVLEMDRATKEASRTIAVLSPDYLTSSFTPSEWATAFSRDPTGEKGCLLPIRVRECQLEGLLRQIVYVDLIGQNEVDAKRLLLEGVRSTRAKPQQAPTFPTGDNTTSEPINYPGYDNDKGSLTTYVRRIIILLLYIASIGALIWGLNQLPKILENLTGTPRNWLAILLSAIPLTATLLFETIPLLLGKLRKQRLIQKGLHGELVEPGYFRIQPYEATKSDQELYKRPDRVDEKVLEWLRNSKEKLLYLTGRSGSGKTSLLNAFVIPRLEQDASPFMTIVVRSFHNPLLALQAELLKPGVIWLQPQEDSINIYGLLERAVSTLGSRRLLLIFDQFEELLILQERNRAPIEDFEQFIRRIIRGNIRNLSILLVIRSDYIGKLQELNLPVIEQNRNWKEISPFTESAASSFLSQSGLVFGAKELETIITEASEIEETRGLIRPITLNMIGLVLERLPKSQSYRKRVNNLLVEYVKDCINIPEIKDCSRRLLRVMVTQSGTKRPRFVSDLANETKQNKNAVAGTLLILGTQGIVRRIDEQDSIWEVSHDFVARLINHVLGNWKKKLVTRISPLIAPLSLMAWVLAMSLITYNYFLNREVQAKASILKRNGSVTSIPGGVQVVYADGDLNLSESLGSLKYLPNLLDIDLANTKITNDELSSLAKLKALKVIDLSGTGISTQGIEHLKDLSQLEELNLKDTKIDNNSLAVIAGLRNLQKLYLDNTAITGSGLATLKEMQSLRVLSLTNTKIDNDSLGELEKLSKLDSLFLDDTNIGDTGLAHLSHFEEMRVLSLDSTPISDNGLVHLAGLTKLQTLWLAKTRVSDSGLQHLGKLSSLTILSLAKTRVSDLGLQYLKDLSNLRELILEDTDVTGRGFESLKGLVNLREIWARRAKITDVGLENIVSLTNLQILALPANKITNKSLEYVAKLTELKELYIGGTLIDDNGLVQLHPLKKLQKLYFPGCNITDGGLGLIKELENLRELKVTDTKITKAGIERLRRSFPLLDIEE